MGDGRDIAFHGVDVAVAVDCGDLVFGGFADGDVGEMLGDASAVEGVCNGVVPFRTFGVAGAGVVLLVEGIGDQARHSTVTDSSCSKNASTRSRIASGEWAW